MAGLAEQMDAGSSTGGESLGVRARIGPAATRDGGRLGWLFAVLLLCASCDTCPGAIVVDSQGGGDHVTIQEGLNAATTGDTVLVMPGTYYETLTFSGPTPGGVTLLGAEGPGVTTVDGQGLLGSPLLSLNYTYYGFTVTGLTFANGNSTVEGAAIRCYSGAVSVVGNVIRDNEVADPALGGAIAVMYPEGEPSLIEANDIYGNRAPGAAGILVYGSSYAPMTTISHNDVHGNTVFGSGIWNRGGGIGVWNTRATLEGNSIASNQAWYGAGVDLLYATPATVAGNSFTGNIAGNSGGGIRVDGTDVLIEGNVFTDNQGARAGALWGHGSDGDSCVVVDNVFYGNTAADSVSIDFFVGVSPRFTHNYLGDNCAIQLRAPYFEYVPGDTFRCKHNWWGTTDPAEISARVYDCSDSGDRLCVDYSLWCENVSCSGGVTGVGSTEPVSWGELKSLYAR